MENQSSRGRATGSRGRGRGRGRANVQNPQTNSGRGSPGASFSGYGGAGGGNPGASFSGHGGAGGGNPGASFSGHGGAGGGNTGGSFSGHGGGPGGRGGNPQHNPAGAWSTPGLLTSELKAMNISQSQRPPQPEISGGVPIKRPDKGGQSAIRRINLLINHFKVKVNPQMIIRHYDIDIKLEEPSRPNAIVSKSDALMIKNKLFSENPTEFPRSSIAYDGKKNIYSAVELPTGRFQVTVSKGEDVSPRTYAFTIKLVNSLELRRLYEGIQSSIPREILQGMDVVMRENPSRTRILAGGCFYSKEMERDCELGRGIIASRGFRQSLKPTSQCLALCLDYSAMPFRKCVPVLTFLQEHLGISFEVSKPLSNNYLLRNIESALKGLKVTVIHRNTNQRYMVMGLTKLRANDIKFSLDDPENKNSNREVGLVDYFKEKYEKDIVYKHLPCLDLTKNKRTNYVPMEFCELVEGQRYPRESLHNDGERKLKGIAMTSPSNRKKLICDMVSATDGPCGGDIAEHFGIAVAMEMTEVTGRVLKQPNLIVRDAREQYSRFTPQVDGQWNLLKNKVLEGKQISRWAVLDFSQKSTGKWDKPMVQSFPQDLARRCSELGIRMEERLFYQPSNMDVLSNYNQLYELLKYVHKRADGQLQILFCVMTERHNGYKILKRICETEIGIITQCCLSNRYLSNPRKDQYLANLALKINSKVGGSTVRLSDCLPRLDDNRHVIFIGADVNHPTGFDTSIPSIAAVAASMNWPDANKYASRICAQPHRTEKIQKLGEMCLELIEAYARMNKIKPAKIILFRDGVSEGQFDMVLNEELHDLRAAIESDGYSPTITLVVAQKRHLTRAFPQDESQGGKTGNIPPGTVIDTTITHPYGFDFYLCSHNGIIGTSKPTHYHVLWDEHGFSSDEIQRLIYNLCYTFSRCTKPVSLVPPVFYADIAAYRGRLYHESMDFHSPSSTSSPSSSSLSPASSDHSSFPKIHKDIVNHMFFT
ncbi:argonaute family protein isoform X2 [Tasmannia lanceolata]|uniref:argonaute family protein isoform X2 n=1 Tax=Tasmannia lanceolata TaxID=3420 RepID=UPI00406372C0